MVQTINKKAVEKNRKKEFENFRKWFQIKDYTAEE